MKQNLNRMKYILILLTIGFVSCAQDKVTKYQGYIIGKGYEAPTQAILAKWLREIHKIDVLPLIRLTGKYAADIYHYDTPNQEGNRTRYNDLTSYSTYEEALEAGLLTALNLI